jgi:heavy metal sensor kinase
MGETIRVRLTLWYLGFLAALLLVFAGIVTVAELRNEATELDATLRAAAHAAAEFLEPRDPNEAPDDINKLVEAGYRVRLLYVRLLTPDGRLLKAVGQTRLARLVPLPHSWPGEAIGRRSPASRPLGAAQTVRLPFGARIRVYRETQRGASGRSFRVEVAGTVRDHHQLARLLGGIALAAPPTLGLAVLVGLFLAGRALKPMEKVTQTARELSAGDLSRRIALPGPNDEIKQLADTFDAMLARLEAAFRSQQNFVADASHELRTPLTILQGHADLALSDPAADPPQYRRALEVVSAETHRLSRVVASLLTLARADAGSLTVSTQPIDLAELCEETLCRLSPLAAPRTLTYEGPEQLMAVGDADWLRQLLLNLVENALHHTAPDGAIRITAERPSDHVRIEVHDNGCGIPPEHLPHVFDRFYRVDKARSRARGGAGLGLAIARWIVERHEGTITLKSQPGLGTTVVVTLPAPQESQ